MAHERLWNLERAFWTGGAEVYRSELAVDTVMVFPPPAGVMRRQATIESIEAAPRWREVAFDDGQVVAPAPDVTVLVYDATASRDGDSSPYRARCSSTWVRAAGEWKLAAHQQTPLGDA